MGQYDQLGNKFWVIQFWKSTGKTGKTAKTRFSLHWHVQFWSWKTGNGSSRIQLPPWFGAASLRCAKRLTWNSQPNSFEKVLETSNLQPQSCINSNEFFNDFWCLYHLENHLKSVPATPCAYQVSQPPRGPVVGNIRWQTWHSMWRVREVCGTLMRPFSQWWSMNTPWKYDEIWKQFVFAYQTPILCLSQKKNFTVDWFILGGWPLWGHSKKSVAVMADTTNPCSAPSWMFKLMKSQTAILQISTEFQWSQKWEVQIEISQFQNTRRVCRFVFHISSRLITSNTWPVPTLMDG